MCLRKLLQCFSCCQPPKEGLNETTFYEYIDTLPVYHNTDIGPLEEGVSLTVTGHILMNCERFSINFIIDNETRDVALHINPRLPQSYVVRNTKVRHVWGAEEVTSPQPFSLHRGNKFTIQVLVTEACYMISINGQHFAEYAHRLPYSSVSIVEVKGDVEQINMQRDVVTEYPARLLIAEPLPIPLHTKLTKQQQQQHAENLCNCEAGCCDGCDEADKSNFCMPLSWRIIPSPRFCAASKNKLTEQGLALPYFGLLPAESLLTGRCLVIEGRVKLLPHSFYINLQCGQHIWPHPIIAFHFNPRFSKQSVGAIGKAVVCRNAWFNGSWADEERSELDTNLLPGKSFQLAIVCGERAFEVYVNKNHITSFKYRVLPTVVDTVYIQGDIKLWQVLLQTHFDKDDATNETCGQTLPFQLAAAQLSENF